MTGAATGDVAPRKSWTSSLSAAFAVGLLNTVLTVSLAALVFSGELAPFLSEGVGLALLSAVVSGVVIAVASSLRGMVGSVQDAAAAILAVAAAGAIAVLPASATPREMFMTIVVANVLTTLVTGAFLWFTGAFGLGRLVKFLPYPVVGGFLAGTGWLIVLGAVGVMTDLPVTVRTLPQLFEGPMLVRWVPGVIYALVALLISERFRNAFVWPALLIAPVGLFYGVMAATGGSVTGWRAAGLLPAPFADERLLTVVDYGQLASVHWPTVWSYAPTVVAMAFIVAISVLLNTTALELVTREEVDLDTELRAAGLANLASGAVGGYIGYQMVGDTMLIRRIGRGTRAEALGSIAVVALALAFGARVLPLLPQFLIGGFLAYIGVLFLRDWLIATVRTLARIEYAIVIVILIVIASVGFLEGVAVGIVATVVLFVVDYARTDVVKRERSGRTARSRVTRTRAASDVLDARGDEIHVLELQGFVFFGTATGLLDRVRVRLETQDPTRSVVVDFGRVTGLDATARLAFEKLVRLAQQHGVRLVLSEVPTEALRKIRDAVASGVDGGFVEIAPTLDAALERCEDRLLAEASLMDAEPDFEALLAAEIDDEATVAALLEAFEPVAFASGEVLMREGAPAEAMVFVVAGKVTAQLERDDAPPLRLETMGPGSLVGEVGFYTGATRSASVVADEATRGHRLTRAALEHVAGTAPEAAAALHAWVVRLLAKRTGHLMRAVAALQR